MENSSIRVISSKLGFNFIFFQFYFLSILFFIFHFSFLLFFILDIGEGFEVISYITKV